MGKSKTVSHNYQAKAAMTTLKYSGLNPGIPW